MRASTRSRAVEAVLVVVAAIGVSRGAVASAQFAPPPGSGADTEPAKDPAGEPTVVDPAIPKPRADPPAPVDPTGPAPAVPGPLIIPDADPTLPETYPAAPIRVQMPVIFNAPTAALLPAGVILSSAGVDTGGDASSELRVGLGDVAEFGFGTTDLIRIRRCGSCDLDSVSPYPYALFKMGLAENRLFKHQPALSLGFRKSFERNHDSRETRVAELYLVASKSLGKNAIVHAGGVFWDASVRNGDSEVLLHERGLSKQLRAFGGIELEPLPRSKIMLELVWSPEFRLGDAGNVDKIYLRPMFAWGVRYQLTDWAMLESGVRIPDIANVNLIDAQIFGQLRFVSRRFANFLGSIKQ